MDYLHSSTYEKCILNLLANCLSFEMRKATGLLITFSSLFCIWTFLMVQQANSLMNTTDCTNMKRANLKLPVFSTDGDENLSFPRCGEWIPKAETKPPWAANIVTSIQKRAGCECVILTDKTLISRHSAFACDYAYEDFKSGREISVYRGNLCNPINFPSCGRKSNERMLLSNRVTAATLLFNDERHSSSYYVWTIEKITFSDMVKPICLWNSFQEPSSQIDIFNQAVNDDAFSETRILSAKECFGDEIEAEQCKELDKITCATTALQSSHYGFLVARKTDRFYLLSGDFKIDYSRNVVRWFRIGDDIPQMVFASSDLGLMPEIPRPKKKNQWSECLHW
ncbi:uncharacterized protein LOC132201322 [Neocloeon triangulifer]|uniref:uncharacterized protein LOC132201322 n=1 Tax=Neocloeon triangulifer TaxID=2078957 RepID=UPI00286F199B|nr:uncharacterized protein LOC132201322 [Neocloeon triangulifer]